jgi:transposase InsO family protein
MKKLNKKKIKWIVREVERREKGLWTIAQIQKITPQHVCKVYRKYKNDENPKLKKPGRKARPITKEEKELVIKTHKEYLASATMIEQLLDEKGKHINHNRIHKILLEAGLAKPNPKKKKKRKYKCYERKHSLSLVHTDWAEYKRRKFIMFEDDASRFILAHGEFSSANKENSIKVFKQSLKHGKFKLLHSDNGSVFRANKQEGKKEGEADFQKEVKDKGIKQTFTRVRYPQGNGKMERLVGTIKQLWRQLGSLDKAVWHYNYKRPHSGLTNGKLRTPHQAFRDKKRINKKR